MIPFPGRGRSEQHMGLAFADSIDGPYRGPLASTQPPYVGVSCRLSITRRFVAAVVRVM